MSNIRPKITKFLNSKSRQICNIFIIKCASRNGKSILNWKKGGSILQGLGELGRLSWGAGGAAAPSALIRGEAGGARIALHTELLPSLLPSEGAFSDVVDG